MAEDFKPTGPNEVTFEVNVKELLKPGPRGVLRSDQ